MPFGSLNPLESIFLEENCTQTNIAQVTPHEVPHEYHPKSIREMANSDSTNNIHFPSNILFDHSSTAPTITNLINPKNTSQGVRSNLESEMVYDSRFRVIQRLHRNRAVPTWYSWGLIRIWL